jgi:hypothetical protein
MGLTCPVVSGFDCGLTEEAGEGLTEGAEGLEDLSEGEPEGFGSLDLFLSLTGAGD